MKQTIGKAIKKPVEINWFLWRGYNVTNLKELMEWVQSFGGDFHDVIEFGPSKADLRVKTLEGTSYPLPDNYVIIRGIKGEFFPCDLQIFNETYEIL